MAIVSETSTASRMTQRTWMLSLLVAVAWLIEAYDIGLMGVSVITLKNLWHLTSHDQALLLISSTIGIVLGVIPAGYLADHWGRRRLMIGALVFYSIITALGGLAMNWEELLLVRIVSGLGLGAMFPVPYTFISEIVPKTHRGRATGFLDGFLSIGYFIAPLTASILLSHVGGWRILYGLGGLGAIYAIVLARYLPESPRWVAYKEQRRQDIPGAMSGDASTKGISPWAILSRGQRLKTIGIWFVFSSIFVIFYVVMGLMPSILVKDHLSLHLALQFDAVIMAASVPGKFLEGWLVERVGRRGVIGAFSVLTGIFCWIFPQVAGAAPILGVAVVIAFFGIAVDPAIKIFTAEQYPTAIRGQGVGWAEGVARFAGGVVAPFAMTLLMQTGLSQSFDVIGLLIFVAGLSVPLFAKETAGRELEDYSGETKFVAAIRRI